MLRRLASWKRWAIFRAFVIALLLPIGLGEAAGPLVAALAGPEVHVCHCEQHGSEAECVCPICNPAREDLVCEKVAVRGACGDDHAIGHAMAQPAILAASLELVQRSARSTRVIAGCASPDSVTRAPPTPPPRSLA